MTDKITTAAEVLELFKQLERRNQSLKDEAIIEAIRERQRKLDPALFSIEKVKVK